MFIILALVLSTGVSYLALNQNVKKANENTTPKMTVALVNEDQGTVFEGNKIAFGDQFVKNVNKNTKQEWYVVSRGVAENGLKNNNYNMMIVIPNDFSRKAVAIDSEIPEKLTLNYKVNATGNKDLKAEAENTASVILEDFNKQIIDVYFASIIGKLQGAQDNIGKIIEKGNVQTTMYKKDIHSPLANYTNQFKTVQDYTGVSVNSFKGFQDVLKGFGQALDEGNKSNSTYLDGFNNFQKMQTDNNLLANNFTNQFNQYMNDMNTGDALKQLSALESANKSISNQFTFSEKEPNVLTDASAVQKYLADVKKQVSEYDTELAGKLEGDIQETVIKKLKQSMSNDGKQEIFINTLMKQPDARIKKQIENLIAKLPSLNMEEIGQSDLPDATKLQLQNVIQFTKKYNKENNFYYDPVNKISLGNAIKEVKDRLYTERITFSDTAKVIKMESPQILKIKIPEEFKLDGSTEALYIDDVDRTSDFLQSEAGEITIAPRNEGDIKIDLHVKLKDPNINIDVFSPVMWQWELSGTHTKETSPEKEEPNKEEPNKEDKGTQTENSKVENVVHKSQYGIMPLVHNAKKPIIKKMENTTGNNEGNQGGGTGKDNGTGGNPGGGTGTGNGTGGNQGGGTGTDNGTGGNPGGGTGTDNGTGGNQGGGTGTDNGTGGNPGGGTGTDNGTGGNPGGGTGTDNGTGGNPGGGTGTDNGTGGNPGGGTGTDNGTGGNPGGGTGTDNGTGGNPGGGTGTDNGTGGNPGGETGTDNGKVIESTTNQVIHQKTEKITDITSSVLIKEAVDTVESYQGLMSLYEMYYGIDLRTKDVGPKLEEGSLDAIATDQSLYYVLNKQSLIDLISNLVSSSITTEIKQDMSGLKQKINSYQQSITSADQNSMLLAEKLNGTTQQATSMNENLGEYVKGLAKWRENSLKLVEEQQVVTTNHAGEQTAVLSLDSGIKSLMMQSQSLVESSKHSLATSDDVYKTFDQINGQAKEIQDSGTTIVSKADLLLNDFTKKMEDDKSFSKNFTKILANSRIGDRQNEMLYDFLASPVQKQNDGVIVAGNAFTPYLIVLTCFIVALFTAYAIANQEKKRMQSDHFEEKFSLIDMNVPTTVVAFGISIVEGISIGIISGRLLKFGQDQSLLWIAFITFIMMAFVLVSTYLLRQIKMVGMFILLVFLSMYLFLTEAVGSKVDQMSSVGKIRQFSPLQYIESFLNDFISGKDTGKVIFVVLFVIAIIGLVSNLFVWHKKWEEKEVNDQTMEHSG
ncbi:MULTISPECIES: type VII secretion protein EsaA [Bacillus]|uniref:type VII secretion protein EsaA n=1 Tax=unclassified Bacillus (in: firmicutes) TaxID=185979 RepID=UPI00044D29B4|nr:MULTISPECIES: type VII secretion protein EsaA [Bacillus]AND27407.1 type VII secretion protein [Bacillus thuringiensis serovar israelensis]EXL37837.1 type VII secretion protein [Bacillus thuringiensis serovar israelensis]KRD99010.1 type VII secretion protein [Bacillus sp. Root131]MCR6815204.1 type VII secretion protein EsaA [Bacillus thuringiensis]NVO36569.1 type VII secretion protein EsaA [Bacillus thuringiensis serovar israelensis]